MLIVALPLYIMKFIIHINLKIFNSLPVYLYKIELLQDISIA